MIDSQNQDGIHRTRIGTHARPLMFNHTFQLVPKLFPLRIAHIRSHIDSRREFDRRLALLPIKRLGIEDEA